METQPVALADIGLALYGSRWQTELAKALGVADRTVRRWASGGGVPRDIELVLAQLARQQAKRLRLMAELLEDERLPNKKSNGILNISFGLQKHRPSGASYAPGVTNDDIIAFRSHLKLPSNSDTDRISTQAPEVVKLASASTARGPMTKTR
jgi:hypothetical protein